MFFPDEPVPLEVVRELAALLGANGLGKIELQSEGEQGSLCLKLKRETLVWTPAPMTAPLAATDDADEVQADETEVATPSAVAVREISAPCVGVYRAPKKPLQIGDVVKKGQLVATVESLRVPNEVVAPFEGTVVELPSLEGQGVEWGQTLLVLEPVVAAPVESSF